MANDPATEQNSLVLSPEQLAEFARVDLTLPRLVIEARNTELRRRFTYALLSLLAGVLVVFAILGTFIYLVVTGHPQAAAACLTAGVLGLVGSFVRSRL